MPEKKVLRLTCPVCETRLRVSEGIERFACLNCGAELIVEEVGGQVRVALTQASAARLSDSQQQLIEVNSALKTADDSYGVGCAIATMGITLVACIILALAIVVQSQPLFWGAIAIALVLLGFVLFMFLTASSRGTDPLLRKRDQLQAQYDAEQDTEPAPVTEAEEPATEDYEPVEAGVNEPVEVEETVEPVETVETKTIESTEIVDSVERVEIVEVEPAPEIAPARTGPVQQELPVDSPVTPVEQPVQPPTETPAPLVKPLVKPIQPPKQNRSEPLG